MVPPKHSKHLSCDSRYTSSPPNRSRSPPNRHRPRPEPARSNSVAVPTLLFINKDPSNLARTAEEIYAVGSHVSRGSRKWRRTKSSLPLDCSTGRILAAARLDSPPTDSRTPSPVQAKPINLKWRLQNSKIASSKITESTTNPAPRKAKQAKSATASPNLMPAMSMLSLEHPHEEDHGKSIGSLLSLYFQTIRPFARSISTEWIWIDNISLVQSSPALTYAMCAFASAFPQGVKYGLHTLALPPASSANETAISSTPVWFQFQAQAISLLRQHIADVADTDTCIQRAELHAMLFLMRLAVVIGDRQTALLHLEAIQRATVNVAVSPDLHLDMSMWKVNIALAYRYQTRIALQTYVRNEDPSFQTPLIEFDGSKVPSSSEWNHLSSITRDRTLLWRPQEPHVLNPSQDYLVQDLLDDDSDFGILNVTTRRDLRICAQLSRYCMAYIRYINADTSSGPIYQHVVKLRGKISSLVQIDELWRQQPRLMLYISHAGCLACRDHPSDRRFFVRLLYTGLSSIGNMTTNMSRERTINAAHDLLAAYVAAGTIHEMLVSEMWNEVAMVKALMG